MYLDFLENRGIFIKELAVKHLARKTKENEIMADSKIIKEDYDNGVFCFTTLNVVQDKITEVENYFSDLDYSTSLNYNKKSLPHSLDRDWIRLVYSALDAIAPQKAEEYKDYVTRKVNAYLSAFRRDRAEEIRDIDKSPKLNTAKKVEKAYNKMESEIAYLKKDFENIFENKFNEDYVFGF